MNPRPTAQDYADIFEIDVRGARLLEDLIQRFSVPPKHSTGIDRILDTQEHVGQMKVIQHIVNQINRANGVTVQPEDGTNVST